MTNLNYDIAGNPDGPALLLVHGFLSSNAQWLPNIEALGQHFKLVLAELWGHGRSPLPPADHYAIDAYLGAFEQIRAEQGIAEWGLIGQSYAAGLTLRYAMSQPAHTTGIVVTNSASAFGDISAARKARSSYRERPEVRPDNRHMPIHPIYARRLPEDIKAALVEAADNTPAEAIDRGGNLAPDLKALHLLAELQVPFLLVNGRFERGFQDARHALAQRYPALAIKDMEGGHAINIEAADDFNAAVIDFFLSALKSENQ